ncbi:MAG: hypothetical protein IPP83_02525 [Flavobacteriales bacterium]|nr:hypothetical protein [Flavobacteriales bacterium]
MRTIGIDVSKATLDVALRNEEGTLAKEERIKNSATALRSCCANGASKGFATPPPWCAWNPPGTTATEW